MIDKAMEILCIDDDPDDIELFEEAISMTGVRAHVQSAMNDTQLFKYFESSTIPSLIFLDGSVMCHYENTCLEEIKSQQHLSCVPVVILSTIGMDNRVNDMYERGAVLFLVKPASLPELTNLLKTTLAIDWKIAQIEKIKEEYASQYPEMKFPTAPSYL